VVHPFTIIQYFGSENHYRKNDQDFQYVEDLVLFVTKGNEILSIIKRPFLLQLFIW
jgi:hypothetical protein